MSGPKQTNFTLARGDDWVLQDDAVALTGGRDLLTSDIVLRSTIKRFEDDPDPGLVQVDTIVGDIEILGAASFRVTFAGALTAAFPLGRLHYDIVIDFDASESYTLWRGTITCAADVSLSAVP